MSDRNGSAGDVEITLADGSVLALMLDPESDPNYKPGTPYTFESALAAATNTEQLAPRLTTRTLSAPDFRKGIGVGYNAAYGLYTRDGYVMPAGAATNMPMTGVGMISATNSPIVAFAELGGYLYYAQRGLGTGFGGRVVQIAPNGTQTERNVLLPGDLYRDLLVADDGNGQTALFATSENATHGNGRLHRSYDGVTWASTTAGVEFAASRGMGRMAYEFMQPDPAQVGDWRIVCITGQKTFAYTLPNSSPVGTIGAAGSGTNNWTPNVKIGTRGDLVEIAAARRHFWFAATDNLFDVDEAANSSGMTSFLPQMQQVGNGQAVLYQDGYVYMSVGHGLIRIRVDQGTVLVEKPQQCAPGWGTLAENEVRGEVTAICPDQGGVFTATYNPSLGRSYICWNAVREFETEASRNPLVAHGPEVVYNLNCRVTRMIVSTVTGDRRLWLGASSVADGSPRLDWVSLPIAGTPLQDLLVPGGTMKFATGALGPVVQPWCYLELLRDGWEDAGASNHILYQDTIVSRGLSVVGGTNDGLGTTLTLSSRADPLPGATDWPSSQTVTTSPNQDVVWASPQPVQGHLTQLRVGFTSPQGAAANPKVGVLETVRRLGWTEAPAVRAVTIAVRYGDGVSIPFGRDPDDVTALLKTATESTKLTLRDRWNKRWTIKLDQVLSIVEEATDGGDWGKTVHARLQGSYLAGPL